MTDLSCSDKIGCAVDALVQVVEDLETSVEMLYTGTEICDLAATHIENIGRKIKIEIAFLEKLAEGARILEARE